MEENISKSAYPSTGHFYYFHPLPSTLYMTSEISICFSSRDWDLSVLLQALVFFFLLVLQAANDHSAAIFSQVIHSYIQGNNNGG